MDTRAKKVSSYVIILLGSYLIFFTVRIKQDSKLKLKKIKILMVAYQAMIIYHLESFFRIFFYPCWLMYIKKQKTIHISHQKAIHIPNNKK